MLRWYLPQCWGIFIAGMGEQDVPIVVVFEVEAPGGVEAGRVKGDRGDGLNREWQTDNIELIPVGGLWVASFGSVQNIGSMLTKWEASLTMMWWERLMLWE